VDKRILGDYGLIFWGTKGLRLRIWRMGDHGVMVCGLRGTRVLVVRRMVGQHILKVLIKNGWRP
jgi:hypothetical protein